jgi:hypothetical protein
MALVPAEAAAIRDAAQRILAGDSVRSIFREWNAVGLNTATGQPWNGSKVRQMLLRPRNAGKAGKLPPDVKDIGTALKKLPDAHWPPVLEREVWLALAHKLTDPARLTHRGVSRVLVGSWLYRCECGQKMRSGGLGANGKSRYMCPEMHLVRTADPVDTLVLQAVERILEREGPALIAPVPDLAPQQQRLALLRAHSEEIASLYADLDSGFTGEQFKVANEKVQREMKNVESDLARKAAGSTLAGVADASDPAAAFRALPIERQRAVIDSLMAVTLHRVGRGKRSFDPASVEITPKTR